MHGSCLSHPHISHSCCRLRLKCDGTRAETRFRLSAKRTSPFTSAGASVKSNTGSRAVRISGSNAGYTKFRGSEGYWLPTPLATFPFTCPPVRHRVPSRFNWTLQWRVLTRQGTTHCIPFLRLIFQPYTGSSFNPFDEAIMTPTIFTLNGTEVLNLPQSCLHFSHDTNQ